MAFSHVIYTSGVFFLTVAFALIAVVALTLRFAGGPQVLKVAVGPADGDNAKLIGAIARHLERETSANGTMVAVYVYPNWVTMRGETISVPPGVSTAHGSNVDLAPKTASAPSPLHGFPKRVQGRGHRRRWQLPLRDRQPDHRSRSLERAHADRRYAKSRRIPA
jgi:hypothetical protein